MSKRKFFSFVMAVAMIFTVCTVSASAAEEVSEAVLEVIADECVEHSMYWVTTEIVDYRPVPQVGVCYDCVEIWTYVCQFCDYSYEEEIITRVYHYVIPDKEERFCNGDGTDTVINRCENDHCGSQFIDEFAECEH